MKLTQLKVLVFGVGFSVASPLAFGQRAASAAYDDQRKVKLAGPVTKIAWTNPEAFLLA